MAKTIGNLGIKSWELPAGLTPAEDSCPSSLYVCIKGKTQYPQGVALPAGPGLHWGLGPWPPCTRGAAVVSVTNQVTVCVSGSFLDSVLFHGFMRLSLRWWPPGSGAVAAWRVSRYPWYAFHLRSPSPRAHAGRGLVGASQTCKYCCPRQCTKRVLQKEEKPLGAFPSRPTLTPNPKQRPASVPRGPEAHSL